MQILRLIDCIIVNVGNPDCGACGTKETVEQMVEVCLAWAEHCRVLIEAVDDDGDFLRPVLVQFMARSEKVWEAVIRGLWLFGYVLTR